MEALPFLRPRVVLGRAAQYDIASEDIEGAKVLSQKPLRFRPRQAHRQRHLFRDWVRINNHQDGASGSRAAIR